jgi:hypothetical protein
MFVSLAIARLPQYQSVMCMPRRQAMHANHAHFPQRQPGASPAIIPRRLQTLAQLLGAQ